MNTASRSFLDYALAYARQGWRVFPLHSVHSGDCSCGRDACSSAGKHPRTKNGVKDATTDAEQITRWWQNWPEANIGIATGIAPGETSGLYVLDIDIAKGGELASLRDGDLPTLVQSLRVKTGSGGFHIYLRTTQRFPNTTNKLGPFIDTRGQGGYVVAPPSRNQQGVYTWERRQSLLPLTPRLLMRMEDLRIHPLPEEKPFSTLPQNTHLEENHREISRHTQESRAQSAAPAASPDVALASAVPAVSAASVAQEARNNYLVSMAGRLRGQGLNAEEIRALLLALNQARYGAGRHPQGPLALEELERTIFKSLARWEEQCGVLASSVPVVDRLSDLMGRVIPEPSWLVPELLCEGLVLLAGKPKLGKSWLALSLALTCALGTANQGGLALGRYEVHAAGVLYLSLEDSASRFQSRVQKLLNGRPVPERFGYALAWKPLLAGGLADLEAMLIATPDTRLVVIDTLARVRAAGASSGNVYQEDYALMGALHELSVRHHLTLVLVHHTRKMSSSDTFDDISGSTGLTGAVDTSIVLKRERGQSDASLHLTGRDIEEQELALSFNVTTCTWTVTGSVAERQVSQARQEVLALLREQGEMTPAEIAKALEKPRNSIQVLLRRMLQESALAKDEHGHYTLSDRTMAQQEQETEEA